MKKLLLCAPVLFTSLFAQDAQAAPQQQSNFMSTFLILGVGILFFYLLIWRPERKRRKAMEAKKSALKKGDKVTVMGIIGTVEKVMDTTMIVKMYDGAKIEFLKAALSEIHPETSKDETAKSES